MSTFDVKSEINGKVWKIITKPGDVLEEDDDILILESMKMEIPVAAPVDGKLLEILVSEDETVTEGQVVAIMEEA
ncbi:MAG: acetyl-CoA carboxylase biotin carboxyl carrier protein [Parvibaculaceae bacterium]|jgi:acetyl-CoA carboxylase biotin carboxyl carrier protein|nr:acetyl-CoA carboxylase biotin carboxyl carrier protein subunit [Parvibaculaceae bacterium]